MVPRAHGQLQGAALRRGGRLLAGQRVGQGAQVRPARAGRQGCRGRMTPRPPEGDWLGSPYLRFERHGSLARCVVDRLEKRNALTPAMYFGVRHAVHVVNTDPALAGLLITGTGDVFIPGGDMSGTYDDFWDGLGSLGMDVTPFDAIRHSAKPVVSAINGLAWGGGMMIARLSDVAVASERATFRAAEV